MEPTPLIMQMDTKYRSVTINHVWNREGRVVVVYMRGVHEIPDVNRANLRNNWRLLL